MKKVRGSFKLVKTGLAAAALATLMGCAAYVDGDGGYGGAVVVPGPYFYGDFHDGGYVHAYRDRGYASRGFAHGHRR